MPKINMSGHSQIQDKNPPGVKPAGSICAPGFRLRTDL